jgi:hypothetical protein
MLAKVLRLIRRALSVCAKFLCICQNIKYHLIPWNNIWIANFDPLVKRILEGKFEGNFSVLPGQFRF